MMPLIRSILAPIFSLALLMLGNGFFITFISLRLQLDGYGATIIGFVHSSYYAGFLVGAIGIESFIRRIKHIRSFAFFASIGTAIIMIQGIFVNPYVWIAARFVAGLCIASLYVVIESWLLIISPISKRGVVLSFYMIALYFSQAASQYIIEIIGYESLLPFLVTGFLCALSVLPVACTTSRAPDYDESSVRNVFKMFRTAPFGFIGCVLSGSILSSIYSFTPNYAIQTGISVPLMMSITIAGGFLLQWPIGYLSDIFDRRKILIMSSFATLLPVLGIIFATSKTIPILALSFFLGGFTFTIYPLSITQVCDRFPAEDITMVTGVLLLAFGVGSVIGPLIAPFFINAIEPYGLYLYIGTVSLVLASIGLYAHFRFPPVPNYEQGDFVPLPRQTPVAYELDPRK